MRLEGLKFKLLVFGAIGIHYFPKFDILSETRFTSKMCPFSVQNVKIRSEQISIFVKVFRYDRDI